MDWNKFYKAINKHREDFNLSGPQAKSLASAAWGELGLGRDASGGSVHTNPDGSHTMTKNRAVKAGRRADLVKKWLGQWATVPIAQLDDLLIQGQRGRR